MQTTTKLVSAFVQLAVLSVAVLIIFRTIQDAGIILYTIHPTLMSIGVSSLTQFKRNTKKIAGNNHNNKKMFSSF